MYERYIDGHRILKGVYETTLPLASITKYLDNVSNVTTTDTMCVEAKSLQKDGDYELAYLQYKAVWPVSNRDFVMLTRKLVDGKKVYYLNQSVDAGVPVVKDVVRAEIKVGSYMIEELGDGKCRITYISHSDPKGSIPEAIKNMAAKNQAAYPHHVCEGVKKK